MPQGGHPPQPRGTARFRRYELFSVCGIWQWRHHSCLLSPGAFWRLVSYVLLVLAQRPARVHETNALQQSFQPCEIKRPPKFQNVTRGL